jgi:L,D-transpeptidase catalytic domain
MRQRLSHLGKIPFPAAVVVVMVISATVGWGISHAFQSTPAWSRVTQDPPSSQGSGTVRVSKRHRLRYVAVAKHSQLQFYPRPRATKRILALSNPTPLHMKLTVLVKKRGTGWVQVYLPVRPNGATAWVRKSAVRLFLDPWSIVIRLHTHRLLLRRAHKLIKTFRVAVGKPSTPTPTGKFFLTELLKQPDPAGAYGPYAYGTSAYSRVLQHFGTGDGQIGLHGSDQPSLIGQSISHGCIRLYNKDIVWLAKRLPLGTPVKIVS